MGVPVSGASRVKRIMRDHERRACATMNPSNTVDFVFCPHCGTRLVMRERFGQARPTCPACGFIHFHDPKVAVIGLVTWRDRVLLIRRGVEPMLGKWALPGGYMDAGEMPQAALTRELREEVGLEVEVAQLLDIFPMTGAGVISRGIVLAFDAPVRADEPPTPTCRDDALEAAWFAVGELPVDLAFDSTQVLLGRWRAARRDSKQPDTSFD